MFVQVGTGWGVTPNLRKSNLALPLNFRRPGDS